MRGQALKLVSLPLWHSLGAGRLQLELHAHPQLAKHWKSLTKKEAKAAGKPGYVPVRAPGRLLLGLALGPPRARLLGPGPPSLGPGLSGRARHLVLLAHSRCRFGR